MTTQAAVLNDTINCPTIHSIYGVLAAGNVIQMILLTLIKEWATPLVGQSQNVTKSNTLSHSAILKSDRMVTRYPVCTIHNVPYM
ncbi:hypothetical protein SCLCIDRAFT_975610 [Scleroderma citrinum Foug A]|uniref:Uncharacterized protein n=1 Tax=Scleroderma citrinum Foug A TaxID=1036808 RepID=A0A0C3A5L7_9AGAM|nr:hypothetical protein SCLCIDRAFT_975610 [Scleroderma citrinum Foug A]